MTAVPSASPADLVAEPQVVSGDGEILWFLGTLARVKLDGRRTGGRFALWEGVLPRGAAPPLHTHPQDETFYVIEGEVTAWIVEPELAGGPAEDWLTNRARCCGPGAVVFAPGGTPHTFQVESDTLRALFLSTPAGIEEMVRGLGEPAQWPWLPAPADGPRVPAETVAAVERRVDMVRHGPSPAALRTAAEQ
jgi:quercetin dioxygenase-like cupin family protein